MVIALVLLGSLMLQSRLWNGAGIIMIPKLQHWRSRLKVRRNVPRKIEAEKEYMKTDEYVEEAAREKLGLVKDNEIVFQEEK